MKAKPCIFLGYGHEEFGYRLWDPLSRKIVKSRDVVFLEDQLVDDGDRVEKSSSSCNTPKYTLVVFDKFRVFCKPNLTVS